MSLVEGEIPGVAVKCGRDLEEYRWRRLTKTDAQVRKRGEQTGLGTLVVHAVNDVDLEVVPLRRGFRS